MHGEYGRSFGAKLTLASLHLGTVALAGWVLFAAGPDSVLSALGVDPSRAVSARRALLFGAAVIYWFRLTYGLVAFMRRRMDWREVSLVAPWIFAIHMTYALLGVNNTKPIGFWVAAAIVLYLSGSLINTLSELQRHRWKSDPEHQGRLYTQGLFRYARHINYFGDIVLFTGYALLTGSLLTFVIPVIMTLGFIFEHSPKLDRHLAKRYGDEYRDWAARTPRLIPWIY